MVRRLTITNANKSDRRLIEEWLPINEMSVEAIREGGALAGHPPVNQLHVWWARRPLVVSRATVAASLLSEDADREMFLSTLGTSSRVVAERRAMDAIKARGEWSNVSFSSDRAFKYNPSQLERDWFRSNLATQNPLVLDVTAGGGSIPFEAGRLGVSSHANDLNPVSAFILRATCQWPQQYGPDLLTNFDSIREHVQRRVQEWLEGFYMEEPQPQYLSDYNQEYAMEIENGLTEQARRDAQTFLWARTVFCPDCGYIIPLSPNWRLDSKGKGLRLTQNSKTSRFDFKIVESTSEQSPGTIKNGIVTCPDPGCGSTTRRGYVAEQAQAGQLGHQLYCVIYRDQWRPKNKSGTFAKRPKNIRGFRLVTTEDDNTAEILRRLEELKPEWETADILPSEAVPEGNKTREPHRYGMTSWREMFSPRQQLANGYCVQAFRELVDADSEAGVLSEARRAAWCYIALGLDKMMLRNNLLTRWIPQTSIVANVFETHDFGMKWSYAEMVVSIEGLGLDWALSDLRDCISKLSEMSGHRTEQSSSTRFKNIEEATQSIAVPSTVTRESADFLLSSNDKSADAIIFDPPYYDNVSYAELSDFLYVWLKRTAGYLYPEGFSDYLTDKGNEAIASPARFRNGSKAGGSVKQQAYDDYVERMRQMFAECRRIIKDDGIMTIMFTHKTTDAWDALTIGIIEAGFSITATWPVKTEADTQNTRDRASARSTILLVCRPKTAQNTSSSSWEQVERQIAETVRGRLPELESYDLSPLDIYLASFGPALEVISNSWPIQRELANPDRPANPFTVTPNDALQVARREVFDARRRKISDIWAENPGDALTEFYILAQDSAGSATIPFDEANMMARCIGLELNGDAMRSICNKKGSNINLLTGIDRFARGVISQSAPSSRHIDRVHTAIALTKNTDVNNAINWCRMQDYADNTQFKGTLEALLRVMKPSDPDMQPARILWSEMYREEPPQPEGVQVELPLTPQTQPML